MEPSDEILDLFALSALVPIDVKNETGGSYSFMDVDPGIVKGSRIFFNDSQDMPDAGDAFIVVYECQFDF
ncbi:MAG: hypothetical protein ACFFAS_07655 [Promethearchaeota archaeon]